MIEKKFELHTRARIQAVSWERFTFSNENFEIVPPKSRRSFMYFSNFAETLSSILENMQNTLKAKD